MGLGGKLKDDNNKAKKFGCLIESHLGMVLKANTKVILFSFSV